MAGLLGRRGGSGQPRGVIGGGLIDYSRGAALDAVTRTGYFGAVGSPSGVDMAATVASAGAVSADLRGSASASASTSGAAVASAGLRGVASPSAAVAGQGSAAAELGGNAALTAGAAGAGTVDATLDSTTGGSYADMAATITGLGVLAGQLGVAGRPVAGGAPFGGSWVIPLPRQWDSRRTVRLSGRMVGAGWIATARLATSERLAPADDDLRLLLALDLV